MKIHSKIAFILKVLFFFLILFFLLDRTNYVFRQKENIDAHDNFAQLERDSIDTIFVGTSHQFCSVNTDLLYDEYGINSYMLATSGQTIPMTYYAVMEAIIFQHPETIIMEVLYCCNDFRTINPAMSHMFFDGMPYSMAKREAIKDLIEEEEQIYYHLNLGYYHARWKELTEADFMSNLTKPRGNFYSGAINQAYDYDIIPKDQKEDMPAEMEKYMNLIVEICKLNDVELILYVAPFGPIVDSDEAREDIYYRQRIFNGIEDFAAEKGVTYYNLFHCRDEIGLDNGLDFMDAQHLNVGGQEKLTRYMAEKGYFK